MESFDCAALLATKLTFIRVNLTQKTGQICKSSIDTRNCRSNDGLFSKLLCPKQLPLEIPLFDSQIQDSLKKAAASADHVIADFKQDVLVQGLDGIDEIKCESLVDQNTSCRYSEAGSGRESGCTDGSAHSYCNAIPGNRDGPMEVSNVMLSEAHFAGNVKANKASIRLATCLQTRSQIYDAGSPEPTVPNQTNHTKRRTNVVGQATLKEVINQMAQIMKHCYEVALSAAAEMENISEVPESLPYSETISVAETKAAAGSVMLAEVTLSAVTAMSQLVNALVDGVTSAARASYSDLHAAWTISKRVVVTALAITRKLNMIIQKIAADNSKPFLSPAAEVQMNSGTGCDSCFQSTTTFDEEICKAISKMGMLGGNTQLDPAKLVLTHIPPENSLQCQDGVQRSSVIPFSSINPFFFASLKRRRSGLSN